MIDISMLRISPKLISVELNRVEYEPGSDPRDIHGLWNREIYITKYINGSSFKFNNVKINPVGRFPTQLFTNIKNDRFKYVKNITEID